MSAEVSRLMDIHWLTFEVFRLGDNEHAERWVVGCHCGFMANLDSDAGFGDSVVEHLLTVGAGDRA